VPFSIYQNRLIPDPWSQVVFISLLTGVLMNVMITRPLIHEMRDNFQERSRELVHHFQNNKEQATPSPYPPPPPPT
jgi:hypothetical protein